MKSCRTSFNPTDARFDRITARMVIMFLSNASLLTLAPLFCCAQQPVSFEKEIQPILQNNCLKCHGAKIQLAKLDLRTREGAAQVLATQAEESRLYRLVSGQEKPSMPIDGKLSAGEIATIKRWIDEGAPWREIKNTQNADAQVAALEDMKLPP